MSLFSKGKKVYDLIGEHLEAVIQCYDLFSQAMEKLLKTGPGPQAEELAQQIDKMESRADEARHKIIRAFLEGALLPESRREILKLIELTDEIANKTESDIRMIALQRIAFPKEIQQNISTIVTKTQKQLGCLKTVVESLFTGYEAAINHEELVNLNLIESEIDQLEEDSIKTVYGMKLELAEKYQLREVISDIADISDIIEDIADMIEIIMVLRKV